MPKYNRFELSKLIDTYVVNPRYREVLRLKLCEGLTYEQVAEAASYSPQHVKSIVKEYKGFLISLL